MYIVLGLQITPGENCGFGVVLGQCQRRSTAYNGELQPIVSTILEFNLLLKVRIVVDVLVHIFVRQRSCTAACYCRIG